MTRDLTRTRIFAIVLTAFALTVVYAGEALAESVWYVDDDDAADFKTIQAALDAASAGDTIIVRDGVYTGDGNRDIDFAGKAVHLRSENGPESCIIDVQGTEAEPHRGFHFRSGEDERSVVAAFTIRGGFADEGGAIKCEGGSPMIANNVIIANYATIRGGGISCNGSRPKITNNTIVGNRADPALSGGQAPARAHNIKVLSDKVRDVSTLEAALASVIEPEMSNEEKAIAIWWLVVAFRHQDSPPDEMLSLQSYTSDAVKIFNAYGYTFCSSTASVVVELAGLVPGFEGRTISVVGHVLSEIRYDGSWHAFDASLICHFRNEDGSVASVLQIIDAVQTWMQDHPDQAGQDYPLRNLPKDQWPPMFGNSPFFDENGWLPANTHAIDGEWGIIVKYSGDGYIDDFEPSAPRGHQCLTTLRKNESLARQWSNQGKFVNMDGTRSQPMCLALDMDNYWMRYARDYGDRNNGRVGSGLLIYEPDFSDGSYRDGMELEENLTWSTDAQRPGLKLIDEARPGVVVLKMQCPYPFLEGSISGRLAGGQLAVSYSTNNGLDFAPLSTITTAGEFSIPLGAEIIRRYCYHLRLELSGADARLEGLRIESEVQCSQRALPTLARGDNTITVTAGPPVSTVTLEGRLATDAVPRNALYSDFHPTVENLQVPAGAEPTSLGTPGTLTFPVQCPGDIRKIRFGGQTRAHGPQDKVRYLVSCDDGESWELVWENHESYRNLTHYVEFDAVPAGTRQVLVRYELTEEAATRLFHFRIDVDYVDGPQALHPFKVVYSWTEGGEPKWHEQVIAAVPATYHITVEGEPEMESIALATVSDGFGGGIACAGSSCRPAVTDCILWNNDAGSGAQIAVGSGSQLTVAYSDIEGGAAGVHAAPGADVQWGAGNIDADPLFAQPANGAGIDDGLGGVTSAEIADFMDGALSPAMARLVEGVPADHIFFIDSENGNDLNDGHSPDEAVKTFEEVFHHGVYDERVAAIPEQETVVVFVLGEKLSNISGGTIRRPNVKFVGVDYPKLYVEVIDGECQGACTLTPYRENIEICGFRIEHLCGNGIDVMADNCWVHHNRFQGAILAGGDVTIGAYDDIVSGCVVEHNVFSGEPANPHSIRILRRARRAVVRYNKFYGSETFVWFKGGTDCSSQENEFFDHDTSEGRKPVSFQSEAVRCFSLNDHLEGEPLGPSDYYIDENATDCFVLSKPDGGGDYHLKSQYGRWDPAAQAGEGGWVFDNVTSPCIDAGDPASDYDNEPMPNFGRVNIGAYGNTDRASRSGPRWNIPGDVNGDCVVNVLDMLFVRNTFLHDKATADNWKADVNSDGQIDVIDMLIVRDSLKEECE
ncbi:MAG: hypothetical protein HQ592_16555 [Planctomycetes bacterium]|nr:hypothetical protein [Planctomycetota bacterium]